MTSPARPVPRDLRAYKAIETPKNKKDYPDKLLRVPKIQSRYGADSPTPDGAILTLYQRDTTSKYSVDLISNWPCPVCGALYQERIPESWLAEGKAEFVEEVGLREDLDVVMYLACPYSHPDPKVQQERWIAACDAASDFMNRGYTVISPVSMGHPIAIRGRDLGIGSEWQHWRRACLAMLEACTTIAVLQIPGWDTSVGVKAEVDHARKLGLPIWAIVEDPERGFILVPQPHIAFKPPVIEPEVLP